MKILARMLTIGLSAALIASPAYSEATLSRAVQQGYDEGFKDCASALDKFVRFVHENDSDYGFFGRWAKANPNASMFTSLTSETVPAGGVITSFSAIKNVSGTCDIVVTEIITSTDSCAKLRDQNFKDWKYYGDLNGSGIYSDPTTEAASVVLTTLPGTACLVTKQIIGYGL